MKFTPVDTGLPQHLSFKNRDTEIQGAGSASRAQIHTVATPEAGLVSAIRSLSAPTLETSTHGGPLGRP